MNAAAHACSLWDRKGARSCIGAVSAGAVVIACLFAVPASASVGYIHTASFGAANSTPANPYPLSNPTDTAVDNSAGTSAHDIYVTDPGSFSVEKFNSSGNLIWIIGKEVNKTAIEASGTESEQNLCVVPADTCQPGAESSSPGAFRTPTFVAVDGSPGPSAGDVYVGDTGNGSTGTVSKFTPEGALITTWGSGGRLTGFSPLYGIAVDPTGNLFVLSAETEWYEQNGTLHSTFGYPRGTTPAGLAVDAEDNLYKADGTPEISKFSDTGVELGEPDGASDATGLAVDPANDDLYVDQGSGVINRFTVDCGQDCTPADSFGSEVLTGAEGISVDATTPTIYAANTGSGNVAVFVKTILPDVSAEASSNYAQSSVTLSGHVDPAGGGPITDCRFEYVTTSAFQSTGFSNLSSGGSVPCAEGTSFSAPADVHADLTGLNFLTTTYRYRLVAENANGNSAGSDQFLGFGLVSHTFTAVITGSGTTALSDPTDVEVDQASHDIYVTDPGNYRIEKFDSAGNFLLMFGKNVNKTKVETPGATEAERDLCTAASGDTCQSGTSSSSAGGFISPTYLAVDNYPGGEGDVYVGDPGDNLVSKFDSSGHIIPSWGPGGTKDGSDADFGPFSRPGAGPIFGVAVGGPNGDLFVGGNAGSNDNVWEYSPGGTPVGPYHNASGAPWLKVDPAGNYYDAAEFPPPVTGFGFDPSNRELYLDTGSAVDHYGDCNPPVNGPCEPEDTFGGGQLSGSQGVGVDGGSHVVYVANSNSNDVAVFDDVRPIVTTGPFTDASESSVTLTGHIDPGGRGNVVSCHFEYGFEKTYGSTVPCTPDPASSNFTGPQDVTATISGFSPGTKDHYRLVATSASGATSHGLDETFITTQPPAIDGLASANLTATGAELNAQVNPDGLETTYQFVYGSTIGYGQSAPVPAGTLAAGNADQRVSVHLEGLQPHVVYHYALVATNADGTTTTEDHTFNFYPPSCPNENVRQQTQANYLPDCRAYELVSPGNAGGTQISPTGPNTGYATSPSRFSYTGQFSTIPGSGGEPIDGDGDLYVATRTDTGWVSHYVGLPSDQAAVDGGPPQAPPNSTPAQEFRRPSTLPGSNGDQNSVLTDPSMNTFLDWNEGNQSIETSQGADFQDHAIIASGAPYVLSAEGQILDRWPTNLGAIPAGSYSGYPAGAGLSAYQYGPSLSVAPGGEHALDCPFYGGDADVCAGDVTASSDLSHFVFASTWNVFAPGGQLTAPGSVYDNDTKADTISVVSKTSAGTDIPSEPGDQAGDPLQIPAVSSDGSHILIAAGGTGPCGSASCSPEPCGADFDQVRRCIMQPSHLYMRVDDAVTYDVSQGYDVNYVGMTADGSKVYFTSDQQLTAEDTDTSVDLYMWSEGTNSLTLISKGADGAGNSDSCRGGLQANNGSLTTQCDITTPNQLFYCQVEHHQGGNCLSDSFIASQSGEIYFSSQEQLDGTHGLPNQENLYVYRNGQVRWVTTLTGPPQCFTDHDSFESYCPRIRRMEVTPDGSHMAFITGNQVAQSQYNSDGHLEMYTYNPSTGKIVCVSCLPSGAPPTSDVMGSQDGLFLTNDGRTFFSTEDALVHADTNRAEDVYEYVDGSPQLITPGTGDTTQQSGGALSFAAAPGLIGVSADGRDVYFGTDQTLVPSDHNGLFYKIYDARSGGGFPASAPSPACTAAEECHGAGSSPPSILPSGTESSLGSGGNVGPQPSARHHRKHHKRSEKRHHRRAAHETRRAGR